jgi:hypothetical protein
MRLPLRISRPEAAPARVLAIGPDPDDIELGCTRTILKLIEQSEIVVRDFPDGLFAYQGGRINEDFEDDGGQRIDGR